MSSVSRSIATAFPLYTVSKEKLSPHCINELFVPFFFFFYSFFYDVLLFLPNVTVKSVLKNPPKRVLSKKIIIIKRKNSASSRIAKRHTPFSSPMTLLHTRATSSHECAECLVHSIELMLFHFPLSA